MRPLTSSLLLLATIGCAGFLRAADPSPLEIIAGSADSAAKAKACHQIAVSGDPKAVQALAALLGDEQLADHARSALEAIGDPAAAEALTAALGKLKGRLLAGTVNSLGVKRHEGAVDALAKIATDPASGASHEALAALGKIATPKAVETIKAALKSPAPEERAAAARAAMAGATRLTAIGKANEAKALLSDLKAADLPAWLRTTAEGHPANRTALFDGKSLDGWEGDAEWFRVEMGMIVAGRMDKPIPRNEFLVSKAEYGNFELRAKVRVVGAKSNGGIQLRSQREEGSREMVGYQADAGAGYWGGLYDESRRRDFLVPRPTAEAMAGKIDIEGWNEYVIRCEGPRVRLWLNGELTADYTEKDSKIPQRGRLGLQIHSGPPGEIRYRDIEIRELP